MVGKLSTLQLAIGASLGVHAALLLWPVIDREGFNRTFKDTPLEVILVNSRSAEAPVKAQAIAQANLAGGGQAPTGRATSPLPPAEVTEAGDSAEESNRQIEQLQETEEQLLAQLRRELAALPSPDPNQKADRPQERAQEERRRKLIQLLAEIEKRIEADNARPKRRYVSASTKEEVYAMYYDSLRRRIEERGTRNFPELHGRKLYGELTMALTVNSSGHIVDTQVMRRSQSRVLDTRAVAIVRAAAPFGPFNADMRRSADELVITSRFRFTREDGLETTLSAPR